MMSYANHNFVSDRDEELFEELEQDETSRKKDYSRTRGYKPSRRKAKRSSNSSKPSCGIGGRRNRRYSL